jgi:hypothetical protein
MATTIPQQALDWTLADLPKAVAPAWPADRGYAAILSPLEVEGIGILQKNQLRQKCSFIVLGYFLIHPKDSWSRTKIPQQGTQVP